MKVPRIIRRMIAGTVSLAVVAGLGVSSHQLSVDNSFKALAAENNSDVFDTDSFFVYTGRYGEEQLPIFEYYYPATDISGTNYKHRKSYYKGSISDELKYGDVFVTEDDIVTTLDENTRNTYELDKDTELKNVGNCTDLMETRSLKVERKTSNMSTMPPSYALYTFYLSDKGGKEYYYSFDSFGSSLGMNIAGTAEGAEVPFAVYRDSAIIPVEAIVEPEQATGDVNGDGEFNVADVVLLQKWLLTVPDTHLENWKAANFCYDDRLDVFDLCLMKRQLIAEMNEKSHGTDVAFQLESVSNRNTNTDNHNEWQVYIAHSESELNDIIQECEDVSAQDVTIDGIDKDTFNDNSVVIIYSPCCASNQYSIIESIIVTDNNLNAATVTKKPNFARLDMCYRRYVYTINKGDIETVNNTAFTDTYSYFDDIEESIVVKWFKEWCQS